MKLRDFQAEDFAAVIEAHKVHQSVLVRHATGLGKSIMIAALAKHYSATGRVMVLVDMGKLVRQLTRAIHDFTGTRPGVEMADERAINGNEAANLLYPDAHDRIVVSTLQTQYSGPEGRERFRRFDKDEFAACIVDECETVFPDNKSRTVVDWYKSNPKCMVDGFTATPFRSDKIAAANLFNHVAADRDIIWGIENGWLVKPSQAFVKVSVDFSTLKINLNSYGERDYTESDIAEKLKSETHLIELAKGIIHVAGSRKSIVVCPAGKDAGGPAKVARALAHYLDAERPGCARSIYGVLGDDEKADIFDAFERDEFQFLTSVALLSKGFDSPGVQAVFNCRKTKSRRLYQQILGRCTRPLRGIVDDAETAEQRKAAIAASAKPAALMVNMVGVDDAVRDMTVLDILGTVDDERIIARATKIMIREGIDQDQAIEQAQLELDFESEEARQIGEANAAELDAIDADIRSREMRRPAATLTATVEAEFNDDLRVGFNSPAASEPDASSRQADVLRRFKYPESYIQSITADRRRELSRTLIARAAKKMVASYPQVQYLKKLGANDWEIARMTKAGADTFIRSRKTGRGAA